MWLEHSGQTSHISKAKLKKRMHIYLRTHTLICMLNYETSPEAIGSNHLCRYPPPLPSRGESHKLGRSQNAKPGGSGGWEHRLWMYFIFLTWLFYLLESSSDSSPAQLGLQTVATGTCDTSLLAVISSSWRAQCLNTQVSLTQDTGLSMQMLLCF